MALLTKDDFNDLTFLDEVVNPVVNARYLGSLLPPNAKDPVTLWDTAYGSGAVTIFDEKLTGLKLLNQMWQTRQTVVALGPEASVTVVAVSWQKLIIFDSLDPYMTRLMAAYIPILTGGACVFVSKFTGEGETFRGALTRIGKTLKGTDEINTNRDFRAQGIPAMVFDWAYRVLDYMQDIDGSSLSSTAAYQIEHYYGFSPFTYNGNSDRNVEPRSDQRGIGDHLTL